MEWKRIRKTKFWWLVQVVLLLAAAYLFGDVCSYQGMGESLEYWRIEQRDYAEHYSQELDDIKQRADQMLRISIFGTEGSFSAANIEKTRQDVSKLKDIHPEILESPFAERWLKPGLSDYVFFVWMFYIISLFQQEKKEHMWQLVRLTKNGRGWLLLRRLLLLVLLTAGYTLLLYVLRFGITVRYWGLFWQWQSPLQSLEAFYLCGLPFSLGGYAAVHILWKIAAQVLITAFFYSIFLLIKEKKYGYLMAGCILVTEYLAYTKIPSSSVFGFFSWFNLFALLDPYQSVGSYQNLNVFGSAMGKMTAVFLFAVCLAVFCMAAFFLIQRKPYAASETNKAAEWIQSRLPKRRRSYDASLGYLEGKKLYLFQKGFLLLILLGLIQGYRVDRQMQFFSQLEQFETGYYEEYGGTPTEEKMERAENEQKRLEQEMAGAETGVMLKSWMDQKRAFDGVHEELKRVWELKQNGYDAELVNPEGYRRLMDMDSAVAGDLLLCTFWVLLFSLGSWYQEKQDHMPMMIRLTKKGLPCVQRKKVGWTIGYSVIAFGMIFGVRTFNILNRFPITGLGASVKSLSWMQEKSGTIALNLFGFFLLCYLAAALVWMAGLTFGYLVYRKKQ